MHGQIQELLLIASVLFIPFCEMLSLILYPVNCMGYRPERRGYVIYSSRARGIHHITPSLQADKRLVFTSARIPQGTGVPNDGFLITTLKTHIQSTFRSLEMYFKRRYKICICSVILGEGGGTGG